jgi:hypothetical protein
MNQEQQDDIQGQLANRTHLICLYTDDPEEAPRLISTNHPQGIPLMVMMKASPNCCYYKINIPNGIFTLESKWGRHTGIMNPGYRLCYCSHRQVKVMITKNTIRFKCPIRNVPTKDDVRVSLDMGINFHIGRSKQSEEEDCKKFFYNFGPNRLEELLQEECEEGIRDFIKKIKVSRVRDVKTELTSALMHDLNEKFEGYGVVIEQVNIMNVLLPKDLRVALMDTTNYDVMLQKQVKAQQNKMLVISNQENKAILKLKRDNMQILFKLQHDFDVEEINCQEAEIKAQTEQQVRQTDALKHQSCRVIDAENIKAIAEMRAQAVATTVLKKAEAYEQQQHLIADNRVAIIKKNAEARLEVAKSKSQALIKEAEAESQNSNNLDSVRKFTEKARMQEALAELARVGKVVISGKSGQDLLGFFTKAVEDVHSR